MEIPKRRKKKINIVENFFDEGTPSGSEDELFNIATGNDLLNQILKICYKTADGCIGCHEIKYLIESSCSSPDSGFRTLSEEPQCKPSKKKNVNKFNSDKRKRSLGKLSQRKRTKVDLIANQKKNDKVFDELLEDYRGNSPIVSTKKNKSGDNSKEELPIFDLDGNESITNAEPPEITLIDKNIEPSIKRHSMRSITNTKLKSHNKPIARSTTRKNKVKRTFQTKSKNMLSTTENLELSVPKTQKFDLDGNEIMENEMSHNETFKKPSLLESSSLPQPMILDFDKSTNLLEFDLDGNEIVQENDFSANMPKKGPDISKSAKSMKPATHPYSLRPKNTVPKAGNFNKQPYTKCKQKLNFDESVTQKRNAGSKSKKCKIPKKNQTCAASTSNTVPKAGNFNKQPYTKCKQKLNFDESVTQKRNAGRSKSKKSKIPKKNQTCAASTSILSNNNCATELPGRTLYDAESFMNSALFDSMFDFDE